MDDGATCGRDAQNIAILSTLCQIVWSSRTACNSKRMDHILAIQETVHENRESIPTGVVANVMHECQQAYKALPKLWKIHYCEV